MFVKIKIFNFRIASVAVIFKGMSGSVFDIMTVQNIFIKCQLLLRGSLLLIMRQNFLLALLVKIFKKC